MSDVGSDRGWGTAPGWITAAGHRLEVARHGPPPEQAPTLVLLHEGLGSVSLWRDFPQALAERTGCGVLVYSRQGYGRSDPVALPRPLRYMHDEVEVLHAVLEAAGVRDVILVGHSDGASIALLYAGGAPRPGMRALVLEAPHVFCEDVSVRSIEAAAHAYEHGDLRGRLLRHHGENTDGAFWGWNRAWLDPGFRAWNIESCLPAIQVPVLVIQGEDDEYGTLRQVESIAARCGGQVEQRILPACGHAPHRDQPALTLEAMAGFIARQRAEPPGSRGHRGAHPGDEGLFAEAAWPTMQTAVGELSWLLTRGYTERSALKLVGDRYALAERQRTAVLRASCADQALAARRARAAGAEDVRGRELWIDGFNLLTTIEAALGGGVVLHCRDGCYRDMASMHGAYRKVHESAPATHLIGDALAGYGAAGAVWYLDSPVSNSGRLKSLLGEVAAARGWPWRVEIVPDPDRLLWAAPAEVLVVSADSGILDRCPRWLGLGRLVVERSIGTARVVDLQPREALTPWVRLTGL